MPKATVHTATVGADGKLPSETSSAIREELHLYAGREVVVRLSSPLRSTKANGYMWGVVYETIRLALSEAGQTVPAEELHKLFKSMYLPVQFQTIMGREVTLEPSTASLDSTSFYEYVEEIRLWSMHTLGVVIPDPVKPLDDFRVAELQ